MGNAVNDSSQLTPQQLLLEAHTSDEIFGRLLARYTNYLTILARVEIGQRLQGKLDAADLVQDVFLDAHRHFPTFRGTSELEFSAWLRQILAGVLANTIRRYYGTQARDLRLEQELWAGVNHSSCMLAGQIVSPGTSPSDAASKREQGLILADALVKLPADYHEVILLRHLEALPFAEVARRMGRSVDSVEKLWMRALIKLREAMGDGT
jgi:RNA polymerase sigma-70 factor, ECF subfamily